MKGQDLRRLLAELCDDLDAGRAPRKLSLRRASASVIAPLLLGFASGPLACAGGLERQDEQPPGAQGGAASVDGGVGDASRSDEPAYSGSDTDAESSVDDADVASGDASAASPEERPVDAGDEREQSWARSSESGDIPRIRAEEPVVVYGAPFPRELVHRVVRRASPSLRDCLPDDAGGRVLLRFEINADGTVDDAAVESSSFAEVAVDECLARVIAGLRFPEPRGGGRIIVRYPIEFQTEESD